MHSRLAALAAALGLSGSTPRTFSDSAAAQVAAARSPLDPLTADEIRTTFSTIEAYSKFPRGSLFPIVKLHEPEKSDVLAGRSLPREAFAASACALGSRMVTGPWRVRASRAPVEASLYWVGRQSSTMSSTVSASRTSTTRSSPFAAMTRRSPAS
jgi:Copper amine oxidase, N2 domain